LSYFSGLRDRHGRPGSTGIDIDGSENKGFAFPVTVRYYAILIQSAFVLPSNYPQSRHRNRTTTMEELQSLAVHVGLEDNANAVTGGLLAVLKKSKEHG
jgi:hypothetical protein